MTLPPLAAACLMAVLTAASAAGQDVRPLAPILEPADPDRTDPGAGIDAGGTGVDSIGLPLPATHRAEAARRTRVRTSVVPVAWTDLASSYDPHWLAAGPAADRPAAFGLNRWATWFAARGLAPDLDPHPFFGPWGLYAYDGRLLDLYRSAWSGRSTDSAGADAAEWLRRGDGAMAADRAEEAVEAYGRAVVAAPQLPHAHLGLAAALAELGDDEAAARSLRQALERYPAWLPIDVDWKALLTGDRMASALERGAARVRAGDNSSRLVAGALHLFGGQPEEGRAILSTLPDDPDAERLMVRGPRS